MNILNQYCTPDEAQRLKILGIAQDDRNFIFEPQKESNSIWFLSHCTAHLSEVVCVIENSLINEECSAYVAKADSFEKDKGLNKFDKKSAFDYGSIKKSEGRTGENTPRANIHPTVKPIDLMRYLVKLITPKGGIILDPYNGSGTTGIAAKLELMNYVGIDSEAEYCEISKARIAAWNPDIYKPQTLF